MAERLLLLIGTRKGAFIGESDGQRQQWRWRGPYFPGWGVQHITYDPRSGTLFAALDHAVYGSNIHYSTDLGESWEMSGPFAFPEGDERTVQRIWFVQPGHDSEPQTVWAGADPGALFKSEDGGREWTAVTPLNNHPTRDGWFPGAGGLMVHTIIQDPDNAQRLYVAISAAGVFRTDDGGRSWHPKNKGVRADFLPDKYPDVGQCCHHLEMSRHNPNLLFQQNHCGVYKSTDGGEQWEDIGTDRLPATFGFPLVVHPHQEETIYVVPQVSDEFRYTPEGKFRVYRSRDGGQNWQALSQGLPQENAYLAVYRLAMCHDLSQPAGIYVGTTTGQLYYSTDEGEQWHHLAASLPPIYALNTALVD